MDPILLFLERDILPEEKYKAEKIQRKALRFWLFEDRKLYKRFFFWSLSILYTSRYIKITPGRIA